LLAPRANAQFSSSIEATVLDPTGAAVSSAHAVAENQDTHVKQSAVTSESGYLRFQQLPPGKYAVEIEATGFQKWIQRDILLEGSQTRNIYPKLVVGRAEYSVTVAANAETVETSRGSISRTLETETVEESPLMGQSLYASVATLAPGITGLGSASGNISAAGSEGTTNFASEAGFQINAVGQRQESNEYQVDGTTVNSASRDGVVNISPEPDTVAEMKVSAVSLSADKGRESGAFIEIFTKPGTNNIHGSLSEMHTDNALMARTLDQASIPKYIRNDFGGTIGGPIFKNKTFFFGSLYWMRSETGETWNETVETNDFVDYVTTNYPNSMAALFFKKAPIAVYPTANFTTVGTIRGWYLPWDKYAMPDIPDTMNALGTTTFNQSPINNGFQGHVRIDHNFSDSNKVFYSMFRNTTQAELAHGRPVYSYINPNATLYNKLQYLHTFTPQLLNTASIGYTRLTGNQPDVVSELPNVSISGDWEGWSQWGPSGWTHNNFWINDLLQLAHGAHTLRAGIDVDRQQDLDNFTNGEDRPYFWFYNLLDFAADNPSYSSGPIADVNAHAVATNLYQRAMMLYVAPFIQEDWKVTKRFTVNAGIRFDYFGHQATVTNGPKAIAFFTPGSGSTLKEQIANGSMQVRGSNGQATTDPQSKIAPRVGFAWDIFGNGRAALHGGYGAFNSKIGEYSYVNNMRTNPPDYGDPSVNIFSYGTTRGDFSYGTSNSGATGFALPPNVTFAKDAHGGLVGTQITVGGIDKNLRPPLTQSWALGFQVNVIGLIFETDYFGTANRHLFLQTDVNRYAGDMIEHNGYQTRLNSSFSTVTYGDNSGYGNSNAGSFGVSKHFTKGWTLHGTYNWGKSLDLTSSNDNGVGGGESVFDAQNPDAQYGRADYDVRQRLAVDAVWKTPTIGEGIVRQAVRDWTFSPVMILQSGAPFTVYTSAGYGVGDYNADGYDYDKPNRPSYGDHIHFSHSDFFKGGRISVSDFPVPAAGTEGNLGRNTFDGPGYAVVNFAVQRSFQLPKLFDRGVFQLRGELLNAFNHGNYNGVGSDIYNSSYFGKSFSGFMAREVQIVGHIRF
jgi:hypothetical protein